MYVMLELNPFIPPLDPGNVPNYGNQFASAVAVKMADRAYNNNTNYYLLY
jgi:hypothetical protein